MPKGKYVLRGNLTIPKGTTLIGEIKPLVKGQPVEGTVLMAYAGRGNVNAKAFNALEGTKIAIQQGANINGVAIFFWSQFAGYAPEANYPKANWYKDQVAYFNSWVKRYA